MAWLEAGNSGPAPSGAVCGRTSGTMPRMSSQRVKRFLEVLGEGWLSSALRALAACYFLLAVAGFEGQVLGFALFGTRSAALVLGAILLFRGAWAHRRRLSVERARDQVAVHWDAIAVAVVALVGLLLRIRGIAAGAPAIIHPDEFVVVEPVIDMLRRGWIDPPVPYHYPTVFKYLLMPALALTYVRGKSQGVWMSFDDVHAFDYPFYLVARYHSAVLGALTIILVYLLARSVVSGARGKVAGLVAAAMFTFSFVHVRESHYAVTDAPMTFFVTAALILVVRFMREPTRRAYSLAGFSAGLACAVKYNALPVVLAIPIAHLLARRPRDWFDARLALALALVPVGFFVGYPYALLRWRPFLEHLGWLRRFTEYDAGARLSHIFGYSMESGFGAAATVTLLMACAWCLYRAEPRRVLLVAYLSVSLYMLTHTGHRFFPRYLLPLLPAAVVLVGDLVASVSARVAASLDSRGVPRIASQAILVIVAVALIVAPAATESVAWVKGRDRPDTRGLALSFLTASYPSGTVVASEVSSVRLPRPGRVVHVGPVQSSSASELRRAKVELVVTSSEHAGTRSARGAQARAWRSLARRLELVADFDPEQLGAMGPRIRVFRLRYPEATGAGPDVTPARGVR